MLHSSTSQRVKIIHDVMFFFGWTYWSHCWFIWNHHDNNICLLQTSIQVIFYVSFPLDPKSISLELVRLLHKWNFSQQTHTNTHKHKFQLSCIILFLHHLYCLNHCIFYFSRRICSRWSNHTRVNHLNYTSTTQRPIHAARWPSHPTGRGEGTAGMYITPNGAWGGDHRYIHHTQLGVGRGPQVRTSHTQFELRRHHCVLTIPNRVWGLEREGFFNWRICVLKDLTRKGVPPVPAVAGGGIPCPGLGWVRSEGVPRELVLGHREPPVLVLGREGGTPCPGHGWGKGYSVLALIRWRGYPTPWSWLGVCLS